MSPAVLHCYADYKWTGPSEPVALLCRELARQGWRVELACARARGGPGGSLAAEARKMGLTVHDGFSFSGGPGLSHSLKDIERLSALLESGGFDMVHVHGSWDHVLAAAAMRRSPCRVPVVRTDHKGREYTGNVLERLQFSPRWSDHLLVLSDRLRARAIDRLGLSPDKVTTVRGAVDLARFCPVEAPRAVRARFGLSDSDIILLLVARIQRHRHFDVLLEAAKRVRRSDPRVKIAVLGRGTRKAALLDRPVRKMGLHDTVCPLGYYAEGYRDILAMADAGLMLVPGSDGSCRAAMQLVAMGKPLVVSDRGVLPDIVSDGVTGIVTKDKPDLLAEGILEMAQSAPQRAEWGRAARQRMEVLFSLEGQAKSVVEVYRRLLGQ